MSMADPKQGEGGSQGVPQSTRPSDPRQQPTTGLGLAASPPLSSPAAATAQGPPETRPGSMDRAHPARATPPEHAASQTQPGGQQQPMHIPRLGTRVQVTVKIRTAGNPADLPPGLASQLQQSLVNASRNNPSLPNLFLVGMAAREGCIQLSMSAIQLCTGPGPTGSIHLDAAQEKQYAAVIVDALGLSLVELLSMGPYKGVRQGSMVIQVGTQRWEACAAPQRHGHAHSLRQLQDSGMPPAAWLGLVQLRACQHLPGDMQFSQATRAPVATHHQDQHQDYDHQDQHQHSAQAQPSCSSTSSGQAGTSQLLLHVQLWRPAGSTAAQLQQAGGLVHGWCPAAEPCSCSGRKHTAAQDVPAAAGSATAGQEPLQILAHCQGVYLRTHVISSSSSSSSNSDNSSSRGPTACSSACFQEQPQALHGQEPRTWTVLEVCVEVPCSLLVRHHQPDGPPTGLQPLSLELWAGERLLHAARTVLPVHTAQAAAAAARGLWWWGARPSSVQAAVQELQAAEQQLWDLGAAVQLCEVQAHQALQADVATWLEAVQQGAGQCGHCPTCSASPSPSCGELSVGTGAPALPFAPDLAQHVGDCLAGHAAAYQLPGLRAMVAQQMQAVLAPCMQLQAASSTTSDAPHAPHSALQQLRCCVLGYPCARCEHLFKQRVAQQLMGVRTTILVLSIVMGVMTSGRLLAQGYLPLACMNMLWTCANLGVLVNVVRQPRAVATWACSLCQVASLPPRAVLSFAIGLWRVDAPSNPWYTTVWIVARTLVSVGEQLPSSSCLSPGVMTALSCVDMASLLAVVLGFNGSRPIDLTLATAVVLLPRLIDLRLRRTQGVDAVLAGAAHGSPPVPTGPSSVAKDVSDSKKHV